MKFGPVAVADTLGAILAHGVPIASLSKGIVLEAGHIATLQAQGITSVTVARLEDGDVDENTAARTVAQALASDPTAQGVRLSKASAGRVNIYAQRAGLLQLDVERINGMNRTDPMITLATLPDLKRVTAGVMLATIKVISYGVPTRSLTEACGAITAHPDDLDARFALNIRPAQLLTASLIETHHAGQRPQPKGGRVLDERLDRIGTNLIQKLDVPHEEAAIANAIANAEGQIIFILTASATSDISDTAPAALRRAGGRIDHFGMPVDPGNLMFVGEYGAKPVVGLPGCARSPARNGADWVLERLICGLPVGAAQISAMGVGGLLKDIAERGHARN